LIRGNLPKGGKVRKPECQPGGGKGLNREEGMVSRIKKF